MKRLLSFLLCAILLTACGSNPASTQPATTVPTTAPTEAATLSTTAPAEETVTPTTAPTEPIHSALYIPGVSVEDVIRYFHEVCLDAEFVNSGNASCLQKWTTPIYYTLHGDPTDADLAVLAYFTQWLNSLEGFPGIYEATDSELPNLRIHFCSQSELLSLMGDQFTGMDGAVTFWYMDDAIYDAIICYRTDLDQPLRNSVILEELYNCLGPIQDTNLRQNSIIYAGFSMPQSLTPVDQLILQLLYHPDMRCGMDSVECEEVIRNLYY